MQLILSETATHFVLSEIRFLFVHLEKNECVIALGETTEYHFLEINPNIWFFL